MVDVRITSKVVLQGQAVVTHCIVHNCRVPCTTQEEMVAIVASAVAAQKKWREVLHLTTDLQLLNICAQKRVLKGVLYSPNHHFFRAPCSCMSETKVRTNVCQLCNSMHCDSGASMRMSDSV